MTEIPTHHEFRRMINAAMKQAWVGLLPQLSPEATHAIALLAAFDAQAERITKLEVMLKRLQWAGDQEAYGEGICPVCESVKSFGEHFKGCALAALLPEEARDE